MSTRADLDQLKIIFNHTPKAGGTSLHYFFQDLFGPDKVYRVNVRVPTEEIYTIEKMTEEEKQRYQIFQGHFKYGNHKFFSQPCLYIGIVRNPIDRIISNYYYLHRRGEEERKQKVQQQTLTEYFESQIEGRVSAGAAQLRILTGQDDLAKAKEVIKRDYLMCCATEQLDRFQTVFARLYGRPDLAPKHRNVTKSRDMAGEEGQALREKYKDLFKPDVKFLRFVRKRFNDVYMNLDLEKMQAPINSTT